MYAGVDDFLDANEFGKMIATNIAAETMDLGQNENRTDNSGTIVVFKVDASGTYIPRMKKTYK